MVNYRLWQIYKCWYKIEILGKFNDFMLRERQKFQYEFGRFINLNFSKKKLVLCYIMLIVATSSAIISLINLANYDAIATDLTRYLVKNQYNDITDYKSEGIEIIENDIHLVTKDYPNVIKVLYIWTFTMVWFTVFLILLSFNNFPKFRTATEAIVKSFSEVFFTVTPTTVIFSFICQFLGHVSNGENDKLFYIMGNWMHIYSQIVCVAPLTTTDYSNIKSWLHFVLYTLFIIPIRYFFLSAILARLQIFIEKSYRRNE